MTATAPKILTDEAWDVIVRAPSGTQVAEIAKQAQQLAWEFSRRVIVSIQGREVVVLPDEAPEAITRHLANATGAK